MVRKSEKWVRTAKERIAECIEKKLTALDLSGLRLNEIPDNVQSCFHLRELNVWGNGLKNIDSIRCMYWLESLKISTNFNAGLSSFVNLVNLKLLQVGPASLQSKSLDIPKGLKVLVIGSLYSSVDLLDFKLQSNLETLQIGSMDHVKKVSLLNNSMLAELTLKNNGVEEIEGIENLVNLRHLDISNSKIADVSFLKNLKNITFLNLSLLKLNDFTPVLPLLFDEKVVLIASVLRVAGIEYPFEDIEALRSYYSMHYWMNESNKHE